MNKKAAAKDPTQFFLNQNLKIPDNKKIGNRIFKKTIE